MRRLTHLVVLGLVLATFTLTGCDTADMEDGGSVFGGWSMQGFASDTYWFVGAERIQTYAYNDEGDCWTTSFPVPFFAGEENGQYIYRREISNVSVAYALSVEGGQLRVEASGTTTGTYTGERVADNVEDTLTSCTAP